MLVRRADLERVGPVRTRIILYVQRRNRLGQALFSAHGLEVVVPG